ncbi:MAG: hypothetical protein NW207_08665 [Cytophagales bacterium]|nr:hypothetical protein [Cytophagales bacterium]
MMTKYTPQLLSRLEDIFSQSDYALRYEKGNFKPGYCILKDQKVVIVNKFYPVEGKINCLIDILRAVNLDISKINDKNKELYNEITQPHLKF